MSYSNIILAKILAMDNAQLTKFISILSPDALDYLEILLIKTEKNPSQLKNYLDSK